MTQSQITRSRVMRRIGVAVAATIAISTLASTGSQAASKPNASKYGGEVKVGIFDTFPGFCVGNNPANSSLMATRTVYESLFEKTRGGDYIGLLAKGATPSTDLKTWTVELKTGITFHNGEAFNADAVVKNVEAGMGVTTYKSGFTKMYLLGTAVAFDANIVSAVATDTTHVVFTLDRAQNDFPGTLYASGRAFMRAPAQLLDSSTCASTPIGTGPFKIVSWNTDEMIVTKNTSYWRTDPVSGAKLPYLDKITFTNVKEGSQRAAAVRKGAVDAAMFSGASEGTFIKDLRQRKSVVTEFKSPYEYYPSLWLNQGKPGSPFKNIHARNAVLSCLDRANYVKARTKGEAQVATSLVGKANPMYTTRGFQKYDPTYAKAEVALYKQETGATSLSFIGPSDTSSTSTANSKFLQTMWAACDITYNFVAEEGAVIIAKAFNASPKAGQYYNAYDAISILLFEGTDVTFNLPFAVTNTFPTGSKSTVAAFFRSSIGTILGLNHHSDTTVDTAFYAGEAANSKAAALTQYQNGTAILQGQAIMGSMLNFYYDFFAGKKLGGIGTLQIEKGKSQRLVTNWGIDWTGVYKK
ncbi:MAG: ABC transporter substrate-binding protein [Actinomycetota bacterium]